MTPLHPVRIASNTKTYVAAAALRLWEDGRLELDAPIERYLPKDLQAILRAGGYRPDAITVRHLLNHTSGLDDHGTDRYAAAIFADPQHRWTRAEQVRMCVEDGSVQGEPGEVYRYSDTGYVLLGEILEQVSGARLAEAVWGVLERSRLGLEASWFETLEPRPEGVRERAHQLHGEQDVSGFDPSFDLWGGGGIVATMGDLARFMRALFAGDVYRDPATLDEMLREPEGLQRAADAEAGSLEPGAYRMGIWVDEHGGHRLYRHTGYWCTSATYVPDLDLVVTATTNQHESKELLEAIVNGAIDVVAEAQTAAVAD
jgi:D-alanyl-D-alanine carboxypeptidase